VDTYQFRIFKNAKAFRTYIIYLLLLVLWVMGAASCAFKYDITTEIETDANFDHYTTFTIIHSGHGFEIGTNPIHMQRINSAIEKEFKEIGYEYAEDPDLQIFWFVKIDTKLEQGIYNAYYSKRNHRQAIEIYEYQVGSLVIDIIDALSGKVVWHGIVSANLNDGIQDAEIKIKEAVKEVFKSYKKDIGIYERNGYVYK